MQFMKLNMQFREASETVLDYSGHRMEIIHISVTKFTTY